MSRGRGTLVGVAVAAVVCALATSGGARAQAVDKHPNLVVILTDDQRWDAFDATVMPQMSRRLVEGQNAVYLSNAFVSNPVCCPSRVSILTGKYSSTTGVYSNAGSFTGPGGTGGGGFASFDDDPNVNPTIATDLHAAGYGTALIGKYLNGFNPTTMFTYVPPGWDTWFVTKNGAYYRYYVADGTTATFYPRSQANYSSVVFADHAVSFIDHEVSLGLPFFLFLAATAPHGPARPAKRDVGRFADLVANYIHPASVGEADVSDKPAYIQQLTWSSDVQTSTDAFHEAQLETLYSLDRELGRVWDALPDDTIVIFTSDNGLLWGEHRWVGKRLPYNESIRVPMVIATKGMGAPAVDAGRIVLNVDIRATLEAFAGLTPQTEGEDWSDPSWQRPFALLEQRGGDHMAYCGLRSTDFLYTRYGTGEEELYDEQADPLELDNVASSDEGTLTQMRDRAATACTQGSIYPPEWPFPIQPPA